MGGEGGGRPRHRNASACKQTSLVSQILLVNTLFCLHGRFYIAPEVAAICMTPGFCESGNGSQRAPLPFHQQEFQTEVVALKDVVIAGVRTLTPRHYI